MSGILSTGPMAFRFTPRMGPRTPFDMPMPPAAPRFPMPPPRPAPMPAPAPGTLPRPTTQPAPRPQPIPAPQVEPHAPSRTDAPPITGERTREAERDCEADGGRDCVECPPEQGEMAVANNGKGHSMSDLSARYQQWVTNFPFPYEWFWSGTWWDGFDEPRCTLLEAKANYAFMFIPIVNRPKPWFDSSVKKDLLGKAVSHSRKAIPAPPVSVEWHFLQEIVYTYCSRRYVALNLTNLKAFWNPMPGSNEYDEYQEMLEKYRQELDEYRKNNPPLMA